MIIGTNSYFVITLRWLVFVTENVLYFFQTIRFRKNCSGEFYASRLLTNTTQLMMCVELIADYPVVYRIGYLNFSVWSLKRFYFNKK